MVAKALPGLLVCVFALTAQTTQYRWLRQLGGKGDDTVVAMGTDRDGNAYVVGSTNSYDYPVTPNARQPRQGGFNFARVDLVTGAAHTARISGGYFINLAFHSAGPDHLYGILGGHLLESVDAGNSWTATPSPVGLNLYSVAAQPDSLLVGTDGQGIFRYAEGHWTSSGIGIPSGARVFRLTIDPSDPAIVHAVTSAGYYRSQDSGSSWSAPPGAGNDVVLGHAPGVMYSAGPFVWRSNDYGRTWSQLAGLPLEHTYAYAVYVDPAVPGMLYANSNSGLFKSTDDGATWSAVANARIGPAVISDPASKLFYTFFDNHIQTTRDFVSYAAIGPPMAYATLFPASAGAVYAAPAPTTDIFVTRLDASGNTVYSTYLGGVDFDNVTAAWVSPEGAVYIAGNTSSPDFPFTTGISSNLPAYSIPFVLRMNPDGTLAWSSSLGGNNGVSPNALAVDEEGNIYLAGTTSSITAPAAPRAHLFIPPVQNTFVMRLEPDGSGVVFSTLIAGAYGAARSIALGSDGTPYIATVGGVWHLAKDDGRVLDTLSLPHVENGAIAAAPDGSLVMVDGNLGLRRLTPSLAELSRAETGKTQLANSLHVSVTPGGMILATGSTSSMKFPAFAPLQGSFALTTGYLTEWTPGLNLALSTFIGDERLFSLAGASGIADEIVFAGSTLPAYEDPRDLQAFVARIVPAEPRVRLDSVLNAASLASSPLAPGEIIVLSGANFGSAPKVSIDGKPAEILDSTSQFITAVAPAGIDATRSVSVRVDASLDASNEVLMPARTYSPAIYTVDRSGTGQAFVLNSDGTLNSPSNPAAEGDWVTIFANGLPNAASPVNVYIDDFYANGIDAGFGPVEGFTGDLYRVRVYIPRPSDWVDRNPDLKGFKMPPQVPVVLTSGGISSPRGVYMSIKQ